MISLKQISAYFGKATILFILASFYFSFWIESFVSINYKYQIFGLAYLCFILKIIIYPKIEIKNYFFYYLLLGLCIGIISVFFWFSYSEINVYITLITAIVVIASSLEFFKKAIKIIIFICLCLAIYEFVIKDYIFVVFRDTQWGYKALNPRLFGGFSGIFRAKALFEGPLALAQFAIGISLFFKENLKLILVAIVLSFLANGRLGIILCCIILFIHILEKYKIVSILKKKKNFLIFLMLVITSVIFLTYYIDESSIQRLKDTLNIGGNSNAARVEYWLKGLNVYFNYDMFHLIFGNSGYFRFLTMNNAEHGWITLLLNNGILGFTFYFFPLIIVSLLSIKYKTYHWMYIGVIFLAMMVQTFNLGMSASLFYWLIIYIYYKEIVDKKKKSYI